MYIFYPEGQGVVFLYSLIFGFFLACVFDVFKAKRILFKCKSIVIFFDDLIFCILSSLLLLIYIYNVYSGSVRWFEFIPCVCGFCIQRFTVSRFLITLLLSFARTLKKIYLLILKLLNVLIFPVKRVIIILTKFFFSKIYALNLKIYKTCRFRKFKKLYKCLS